MEIDQVNDDASYIEATFFTTKEAAQLKGIALRTIQHLCKIGILKSIKIGRNYLVDKDSLNNYVRRPSGRKNKIRSNT